MNYLDQFEEILATNRIIYSYKAEKPNEHCCWQNVGIMREKWAWVENDEHYRERIKKCLKNKKI